MYEKVLKDKDNAIIYFEYTDSTEHKFKAKYKYMDTEHCYLSIETPIQFTKPKINTVANILVYRPDGVYKAKTKILDVHFTIMEVVYFVELPKTWDYAQLRTSSRKKINLHFNLDFDGYTINSTMNDISVRGFSFYSEDSIPNICKQVSGKLTIDLPKEFKKNQIIASAKFKREYEAVVDYNKVPCFVYKILDLSAEDSDILKMLLISSD